MSDESSAKDFNITLVSEWAGYNSTRDKTNIAENFLVRGSQNVYKKLSGTISVRSGQKRRGATNTTLSPVSSEYVWNTSWGATYPLWVTNSTLQVEINGIWNTLLSSLTKTRYVFDKWWDNVLKKDVCLFVNGQDYQMWSGGSATVLSSTANTVTKTGSTTWQQSGFTSSTFTTIGDSTTQFDITNTTGTTYRYTYDTVGTNPNITATSVPVGTYILIGAQNFTTANNGIFVVTGSGANYFEVTNASGFAENNKTIGTGYIYTNYTKVFIAGGVTYAYTGGESTTTLTGVTPDATSLPVSSVVLQAVITYPNTPAASGFTPDFIKVINNQSYIGSYTSRLCYISSSTNYTNFTVPIPRVAGDPELLTLDATLNGISVRQGDPYISFGNSGWAVITYTDITVGTQLTSKTTVDIKPVSALASAYAHEFIDTKGDSIVYLSKDKQVRTLGDFTNLFQSSSPTISQEISLELSSETFTGGGLRCIGDYTYVTAPNSGKVYLYQVRQGVDFNGQVVAERLWHPPQIWNATRIDEIGGVIYAYSNANPQLYEIWDTGQYYDDSPSGELIPYACVAAFGYRNAGRRQGLIEFDKVYEEGYITEGSALYLQMNYNYLGTLSQIVVPVNTSSRPAYLFRAPSPSLGDSSLGDEPLGQGISDVEETIPKFRNINSLATTNCFEYQPILYSESANARWEILALGTNQQLVDVEQPNFIINKLPFNR